jgi:hypothetical protein
MKITPAFVSNFETRLNTLISEQATRIVRNQVWDKFVDVKTSEAGRELYFFLLESAKLQREGQGGNKRFEDVAATYFEVVNENVGAGLVLTKNEIEDNQMAGSSLKGMPALDYAASWARNMGAQAARWPQDTLFDLLALAEAQIGYDGVAFFSKAHPVDMFNVGAGTYANLFSGAAASTPSTDPQDASYPGACPIDEAVALDVAATNFAKAVAYIQGLKGPEGRPRNLRVVSAAGGVGLRKRLAEVLDTKMLTLDGIENVVSRYGIEPVICSEIPATDLSYYLICEFSSGEGGPLIYQDREPFALTSYDALSFPELARMKRFEWHYDGRNAMAFGHPWLIFKVKKT